MADVQQTESDDELDDESDAASVASDVTQVSLSDFPACFAERDGRLFHSHGDLLPYPLPADTREHERQCVQHNCLRNLIGSNYIGPVADVLLTPANNMQRPGGVNGLEGGIQGYEYATPGPGGQWYAVDHLSDQRAATGLQRRPSRWVGRAVDLGTGKGNWVLEMAAEFPNVKFTGLDIVPVQTQYPPRNVQFLLHDMTARLPFADGELDLVHARCISTSVLSYPDLLAEVARVLRPGGLFLAGEFARRADFAPHLAPAPGTTVQTHAPGLHALFAQITGALRRRRPSISCALAPRLRDEIANGAGFADVDEQVFCVPIGPWPNDADADLWPNFRGDGAWLRMVGFWYRATLDRYANSMRPMLVETGVPQTETDRLIRDWRHDLATVHGMVTRFHLVHARKV